MDWSGSKNPEKQILRSRYPDFWIRIRPQGSEKKFTEFWVRPFLLPVTVLYVLYCKSITDLRLVVSQVGLLNKWLFFENSTLARQDDIIKACSFSKYVLLS